MITFNSVTAFQTTAVDDSITITYSVTAGEVVSKVYIDMATNAHYIDSTTDSEHTLVLEDAGLFTTPGTITITPAELLIEGYAGTTFDEMQIITLTDTTNTFSFQYAYYDIKHLYYCKADLLDITADPKLDVARRKKLLYFIMRESLLRNAQLLGLIEDCIKYFAEMNVICGYDRYCKCCTTQTSNICINGCCEF